MSPGPSKFPGVRSAIENDVFCDPRQTAPCEVHTRDGASRVRIWSLNHFNDGTVALPRRDRRRPTLEMTCHVSGSGPLTTKMELSPTSRSSTTTRSARGPTSPLCRRATRPGESRNGMEWNSRATRPREDELWRPPNESKLSRPSSLYRPWAACPMISTCNLLSEPLVRCS